MLEDLEPTERAEVYRLVRGQRMMDAIKHLRTLGADLRTAKELVERVHIELDPDAALAHEQWLDAVVQELGAREE